MSSTGLRQSLGYALFVGQGMVAWARAWRSYTSETPPITPSSAAAPHVQVPLELASQVALVLAEMIFHLQKQEVCSC